MSQPRTLSDLFGDIARLLCSAGKLVKQHREAEGFTRADLAKQTGLTVATIREVEAGRIADLETWTKLLAHSSMRSVPEQARRAGIVRSFSPNSNNGHNGLGKQ